MSENVLYVTDEAGNEYEMNILFTFESEDTQKKYVFFYDPKGDEDIALVSIYDDEGNLFEIEDPEEFAMAEEVLRTFYEDEAMNGGSSDEEE